VSGGRTPHRHRRSRRTTGWSPGSARPGGPSRWSSCSLSGAASRLTSAGGSGPACAGWGWGSSPSGTCRG